MNRIFPYFFIGVSVLLAVSGCVHESTDGPTQTFTYDVWVPLSALLVGIAAGPAGWYLRKVSSRFGWTLLILCPLTAVVLAPSLFCERAVVDDSTFSMRTGIWGLTAVHRVEFDNLQQVRLVSEVAHGRRGSKHTNYFMLCEEKDGKSVKIPVNNQVSQAAAPHFLKQVSDLGIPIRDEM